jgi:hypothetical protein
MTNMRDKIKGLLIAYEGYGFSATADAILALVRDEPMTKLEELKAARDAAYDAEWGGAAAAADAFAAAYEAYDAELKKTKETK